MLPIPKPKTLTVSQYGPAPRGRPVVVPPRNLALLTDKSKPQGYHLMWQKTMPEAMKRANQTMDVFMPPGLLPEAMRSVLAKKHRREH